MYLNILIPNILALSFIIRVVYCNTCPQLKPNSNVVILCSQNKSIAPMTASEFECSHNNTSNLGIGISSVEYKCDKHYKPVNRRQKLSGVINCAENGTWTNERAFQNFRCIIDCGKQSTLKAKWRITRGNATEARSWPWVATIFREKKDGQFKYVCGGTLIGRKTVLTAAHCVTDQKFNKLPLEAFRIFLASFSSTFQENLVDGVQLFSAKEIHAHPDYSTEFLQADVAVIVLNDSVSLTDFVLPVCLPRSYAHDALIVDTEKIGEIASFGIDSGGQLAKVLQHAHVPIINNTRCHDVINVAPHSEQFCGENQDGATICRGDSGSGIIFKSAAFGAERYSVHGIVSDTADVTNDCTPVVVFAKVFSYISWIEERQAAVNDKIADFSRTCSLYTRAERRALSQLRPMVVDFLLEDYMHKDEYLINFLRHNSFNLKDTKVTLRTTMNWRKKNRLNEILNEDFTYFRENYPIFQQAFDKDGRIALIYWMGIWNIRKATQTNADYKKFQRYLLRNLEEKAELARTNTNAKGNITGITLVTDLYGINAETTLCRNCVRAWAYLNQMYETHYPQLIHAHYIINTSPRAARIVEASRPFISEHSLKTTHVFGNNKTEWSPVLLSQIPADQLFIAYGGTRSVKLGTKRIELAV